MASYEILKTIVRNGSDLTLTQGVAHSLIHELAALAKSSGARLTIPTSISYDLMQELSRTYGRSIAFVDGLDNFKKE